jgi:hypothetical protein
MRRFSGRWRRSHRQTDDGAVTGAYGGRRGGQVGGGPDALSEQGGRDGVWGPAEDGGVRAEAGSSGLGR